MEVLLGILSTAASEDQGDPHTAGTDQAQDTEGEKAIQSGNTVNKTDHKSNVQIIS